MDKPLPCAHCGGEPEERELDRIRARAVLNSRLETLQAELDQVLDLLDDGHVGAASRHLHEALRRTGTLLQRFDEAHAIARSA